MFTEVGLHMFLVSFYMKTEVTSMKTIPIFIKKLDEDFSTAFSKCSVAE